MQLNEKHIPQVLNIYIKKSKILLSLPPLGSVNLPLVGEGQI